MTAVALTVNGKAVTGDVDPRTLLVQFLRENLRLTGTHWAATHRSVAPAWCTSTARRSNPAPCSSGRSRERTSPPSRDLPIRTDRSTRCRRRLRALRRDAIAAGRQVAVRTTSTAVRLRQRLGHGGGRTTEQRCENNDFILVFSYRCILARCLSTGHQQSTTRTSFSFCCRVAA
jgi:hypothetical protein